MIKLLHSFPKNENKFKEYCRLTFEIDELENTYVPNLSEAVNIYKYDAIILYYLRHYDCEFLLKNEIEKPVILFCWGADMLSQGKFYNKFLLQKTKRLRRKISLKQSLVSGTKQMIKESFPVTIDYSAKSRIKLAALKKIHFIILVMPGDFWLIKKNYDVDSKLHHLNYVNL